MAYPLTLPGLDEARLDAIKALIVGDLANLNTALGQGGLGMQLTEAQIMIGDPLLLPASRISICGGGERDGQDYEATKVFAPISEVSGFEYTLSTNIYVYIHPNEFPISTQGDTAQTLANAGKMERAMARICDHLRRRIFNTRENSTITLGSREYSVPPNYDVLSDCHIAQTLKGYYPKSIGSMVEAYSAHLLHRGTIQ